MGESLPARGTSRAAGVSLLPWLGLLVAFSPVLAELGRTISVVPFGWSVLVAPLLGWRLHRRLGPAEHTATRPGFSLMAAGLLLELLGLAGGSPSIAQLGLPVAFVGLALTQGSPRLETAVIAFWAIPLPSFLFLFTTPHAEAAFAHAAVATLKLAGLHFQATGPLVRDGGEVLEFIHHDSGLHIAYTLGLLGYYGALTFGSTLARGLAVGVVTSLLAIPLQFAADVFALVLLPLYGKDVAAAWLAHGVWIAVALPGVAGIDLAHRLARHRGEQRDG